MKKLGGLILIVFFGFLLIRLIIATRAVYSQRSQINPKNKPRHRVILPAKAIRVAPDLYYLGEGKDVDGKKVEGYAFIYRKENQVKREKGAKRQPSCYGYLSPGAKWKTLEPYLVDPENLRGLDGNFIRNNLALNINKWESAAGKDILGPEAAGVVDGVDTLAPDNKNEVLFGEIAEADVIAMTIVWGYFSGPIRNRALVEWDQIYDDYDFDWSSSGEPGKMDFENIATHELGHSVGMNDVYQNACLEVTMYGYAELGETKKRTLETPDITGVYNLYK